MKHIFIVLLFVILTNPTYCQKTDSLKTKFTYKNSVQLELGGHGLIYSLNYERILLNGQRFKTTAQVGFAYYPRWADIIDIWLPVEINEIISFNKHHIELGLGYVFINESTRGVNNTIVSRQWEGLYSGRIGYRYQKPNGRFVLRVSFTPLFGSLDTPFAFHALGGVALGYSFGK